MSFKDVLNWPKKPGNIYNPWWLMVWRAVWGVPVIALVALASVFVAIGFGPTRASELLREWT